MKPAVCLLLFMLLPLEAVLGEEALAPFTTDGCSAFPDGTIEQQTLWKACCIAHDIAYWKGGTYEERLDADLELEQCVAEIGEPAIALVMLAGVRVGGSPYFPTEFRWGYGWPYLRGYQALTPEEEAAVVRQLNQINFQ